MDLTIAGSCPEGSPVFRPPFDYWAKYCPVFRSPFEYRTLTVRYSNGDLNSGPFNDQTVFDHLNTGRVCYSDPRCIFLWVFLCVKDDGSDYCSSSWLCRLFMLFLVKCYDIKKVWVPTLLFWRLFIRLIWLTLSMTCSVKFSCHRVPIWN